MSTIINATTTNGVVIQPDNSGSLVLQTNSGTTALTIDTSQRAAFVAGTAALPAITTTGDTNTGMFFPAADTIAFAEGGTEAMRLDSSGNVGIGTASPTTTLTVVHSNAGAVDIKGVSTDGARMRFYNNAATTNQFQIGQGFTTGSDNVGYLYNFANADIIFGTNSTERLRISSNVIYLPNVAGISYTGAGGGNAIAFKWTSNVVARIDNVLDVTLASVSDYRIKRNIKTQTAPALERVMALRPVTYQMADYGTLFKANDDIKEGFIAHEVQEVIPSGADGMKDDEKQIQTLRSDAILSVAIKAIQEQQTIINDLKARVETLEAK